MRTHTYVYTYIYIYPIMVVRALGCPHVRRHEEAETRLALERAEGSQRRVETLEAEAGHFKRKQAPF